MPLASFHHKIDTINDEEYIINSITDSNHTHKDDILDDDATFSGGSRDSLNLLSLCNPETCKKQYEKPNNILYSNRETSNDQEYILPKHTVIESPFHSLEQQLTITHNNIDECSSTASETCSINAIKNECFSCIMPNCKHNDFLSVNETIKQKTLPLFKPLFCKLIQTKSFEEIQDLLTLNLSYNIFTIFQMKCIFRIHFNQYPYILYCNAKKYCINISKHKNNWWSIMREHFIALIDFTQIDMCVLVDDIKNDKIFSDAEMLSIIKDKVTNNNQTFRMSNSILTSKQINNLKIGDKIDYFDQFWDSGTIININVELNCAIVTSEEYYPGTQHRIQIDCNKIAIYHSIQNKGQHCLEHFRNIKLHDQVLVNYKFVCDGIKYCDKWIIATVKHIYSRFSDLYWITVDPMYQTDEQPFPENYKFYLNSVDEIQPIF